VAGTLVVDVVALAPLVAVVAVPLVAVAVPLVAVDLVVVADLAVADSAVADLVAEAVAVVDSLPDSPGNTGLVNCYGTWTVAYQ
jgi:hypothetical protein